MPGRNQAQGLRVGAIMNARKFAALAATAGLVAFAAQRSQAAENPFAYLAGSWSGAGKIVVSNGSSERIRCRGTYKPASASELALSLRCASDSYKFELASDITYSGGNITGSWNEASRGVVGQLSGKATPALISATASSIGFTATLSIATRGNTQNVSMKSPGSEVSEVTISLARGGK